MQSLAWVTSEVHKALILVTVLSMVALITMQVGSRLWGSSITWTEELSRFLFVWTIWLGLAASFRTGSHPSLDLLPTTTNAKFRFASRLIPAIATSALFMAVGFYGWRLLQQQIAFGEQSAALEIGMWWITLPIVLGSALGVLGTLTYAGVARPEDLIAERKMAESGDFEL